MPGAGVRSERGRARQQADLGRGQRFLAERGKGGRRPNHSFLRHPSPPISPSSTTTSRSRRTACSWSAPRATRASCRSGLRARARPPSAGSSRASGQRRRMGGEAPVGGRVGGRRRRMGGEESGQILVRAFVSHLPIHSSRHLLLPPPPPSPIPRQSSSSPTRRSASASARASTPSPQPPQPQRPLHRPPPPPPRPSKQRRRRPASPTCSWARH